MTPPANNTFSFSYFKSIIKMAREAGYAFYTVGEFLKAGCPKEKAFIIRHDLDQKPASLSAQLRAEMEMDVRSTIYVRVMANDYNPFNYLNLPVLLQAERDGFEMGLHTNFLEFATINELDPFDVLKFESRAFSSFFENKSFACHRDFNYMYNSLPWVVENWDKIKAELGYEYQAYDPRIMDSVIYVNEGYHPHLCWRFSTPEQAIATGKSVCLLTHPHFWWEKHPFEAGT
jgi:hypothetical protein